MRDRFAGDPLATPRPWYKRRRVIAAAVAIALAIASYAYPPIAAPLRAIAPLVAGALVDGADDAAIAPALLVPSDTSDQSDRSDDGTPDDDSPCRIFPADYSPAIPPSAFRLPPSDGAR